MFLIFISIAVLVSWGFKKNQVSLSILPPLIVAVYTLSLLPTMTMPYLIDDLDVLYTLRIATTSAQKIAWFLNPHNEHVIPAVKALMYLAYTFCGIYMPPIHLIIIFSCALILVIFYKLILKLTDCAYTALFGLVLLSSVNLADFATYMFIEANLFFCLGLFLLLFYAQVQFFSTQRKRWLVLAFFSVLLNPWTFNLGLLSIFFVLLFEYLCIAVSPFKKKIPILLSTGTAWAISLLPYVYSFQKVLHADHYVYVGKSSALEVARFWQPFYYVPCYVINDLIPNLLPHVYLSMGLFFLALTLLTLYRQKIDYKKIIFFLLLGLGLTYVIYVFRLSWGLPSLDRARYDILPSAMLCAIYAFIFDPFIKERLPVLQTNQRLAYRCLL